MKKNILIVTGGAGFVGSNLIEKLLIKYPKFNIISIDNYSSGKKKNHINSKNVKYLKCNTKEINQKLIKLKKKIHTIFHFGEFSRIYKSFKYFNQCIDSNLIGSKEVFMFCLRNKINLIYSATSASLGNNGDDQNLSPYSFSKSKNLELLENLKKWFNFRFSIIYFYNVYGERQISSGEMSTVIGIFEEQFKKKKPLTVVLPGSQTRRFTYIKDTVNFCLNIWKSKKNGHFAITNKKSYSILEVAKMFSKNIKFLKARKGERFASALTDMNLNNKITKVYSKTNLKSYINNRIKKLI